MQINTNVQPYQSPYLDQASIIERAATQLSVNEVSNNPSALSIADTLKVQSNGYIQAVENANNAIASTQIANKAISEQSNILDIIKEKLLQASTDTTSQKDREVLFQDVQKLMKSFDSIASNTSYNGESLLQASSTNQDETTSQSFQIGTQTTNTIDTTSIQANSIGVGLNDLITKDPANFSFSEAKEYLSKVDKASNTLNDYRSDLNSTQNQLASLGKNLINQEIQTREAQSEINGANIAQEISNFNKQNILSQVGTYTQSQFNITQQTVLRLLT